MKGSASLKLHVLPLTMMVRKPAVCDEVETAVVTSLVLLMEEILHHLRWVKPYKQWDNHHLRWCRISSINSMSETWKFYTELLRNSTNLTTYHFSGCFSPPKGGWVFIFQFESLGSKIAEFAWHLWGATSKDTFSFEGKFKMIEEAHDSCSSVSWIEIWSG